MNLINLILAYCLLTVIQSKEWYEENDPHFLTDTSLPELLKTDNTTIKVVKFFAPFCGYCRYLKKFFEEYKQSHEIHQNLKFYDVNCQYSHSTCIKNKVTGYPAVIVFDTTGKQIRRLPGMYPKPMIDKFLDDVNNVAANLPSDHPTKQPVIQKQKEASNPIGQTPKEHKQQAQQKKKKSQEKKETQEQKGEPSQSQKKNEQTKDSASKTNNDLEAETSERQNKEGSQQNQTSQYANKRLSVAKIVKYFLYIITGVIGGYYAFNVFRHKYSEPETAEQTTKFLDNVEIQPQIEKKEKTSHELQEQIKIDQIADQNL